MIGGFIRSIGTETLGNILYPEDRDEQAANDEAELLDEQIFFYIPDAMIKKSDKVIAKYVNDNL